MSSTPDMLPEPVAATEETQQFRSQMGHISRHSLVFFGGTVFTAIAGYLFKVYLARVLGAEILGLYALGMTVAGLFSIFGALGLPQAAVRFVAAYRARKDHEGLRSFVGKSTVLLLALNLFLGGIVVLVGPWLVKKFYHAPTLVPYLGFFAAIMLLGALTNFWSQVLVGYRDVSSRAVINNFFGGTLTIVLTITFFALRGKGLGEYLSAQLITLVLVLILLLAVARRLTPVEARGLSPRFQPFPREVLHFSTAVFGIDFLKFLLAHSDKVLIGTYLNPREVGIYSVAAAIVVYVAVVLQSVNQIFAPTIADLHARQELQVLSRLFQTLTKWIIGLTLPLASVVIAFARPIMGIFGGSFESGWPILVLGTLGQLVSCGVGSVGMLLLMSGNQRRLLRVQIGMAVVMLTLNIFLIPKLGILGAAIGAAVTNAGTNLWNLVEVRRVLGLSPYNRTYVRLLFPVVIMLGIIMAMRIGMTDFHHRWLMVAGALLMSYIVFVGGMLLIGLDNDDRLVLNAIRGRLRGNFQKAMGSS